MKIVNTKKRITAVLMSFVLLVLPMMQIALGGETAYAATGSEVWSDITGSEGFNNPSGVAIGSDGTVYVTDSLNQEIKKLSKGSSTWEDITGSEGFNSPVGVAVGSDGTVYVTDTSNHKVKKLPKGSSAWEDITGSGGFKYPQGMAIGSDGMLYVVDSSNKKIKKLPKGSIVWEDITGSGGFNNPVGAAIGSDGTLYVADTNNHRIKKLPSGGNIWEDITGSGGFKYPQDVAIGSDGTVYVGDTYNNRIKKLPRGGSTWEDITGSGGFKYPSGMAIGSDGTVYVVDTGNNQIKKGTTVYTISFNSNGGSPEAADQTVITNQYAIEPAAETKTGYTFGGWYSSSDFSGEPFDFEMTAITRDQALYAKWMSQAKAITSFNFAGLNVTGVVDDAVHTIALTVPYGTNVTALVPTFTTTGSSMKVGDAEQTSGTTEQDFTAPVTYTVVAEDNSTQDYTVTVTVAASNAKEITSFNFEGLNVTGVVDEAAHTIALTVPYETDVTALISTFTTTGSSVKVGDDEQTSGTTAQDFTAPVTYTVVAADNSTQDYVVMVTVAASNAKEITSFNFAGLSVTGEVDETAHTIALTVPYGTDVTALTPTYTTTGASVKVGGTEQTSGTTAQDFTAPVTYTVVAADNSTQDYVVTVSVAAAPTSAVTSVSISPATASVAQGATQQLTAIVTVVGGATQTVTWASSNPKVSVDANGLVAVAANAATGNYTITATSKADESKKGIATITVTAADTPSGGGGGGGSVGDGSSIGGGGSGNGSPTSTNTPVTSTDGKLTLPAGKRGEVILGDAVTISIPANATNKELKITIEKVLDTQRFLTDKDVLASPVFEILKNFTENFSNPVTLTFAFDPASMKDNKKPSVFYYDEVKKSWVEIGGEKINENHISVKSDHFTKYAVFAVDQVTEAPTKEPSTNTETTVNFSDISGHWAEANIKQAVGGGIVTGYPDGMFKPGKTVTRAEFAVMVRNALKLQGEGTALSFTDTTKIGSWAQKAVAQAVQEGIIKGYKDGTFRPNVEITRAEMAVMLANALGQNAATHTATGFADDKDIPAWARASVAYVKQAGIVKGKGDNQFAPQDHATRAEAITALLNILAQKNK